MEILGLIILLMLIIYFRWIVIALVAIAFTVGGGPLAGLLAGFITHWVLKLIGWWLAYHVFKSVVDDAQQPNQEKQ